MQYTLMLDKASIRRRPMVLQNECSDYQGPLETVWGTFLGTKNASKIPSHYFSIQAQCYGLVNGTKRYTGKTGKSDHSPVPNKRLKEAYETKYRKSSGISVHQRYYYIKTYFLERTVYPLLFFQVFCGTGVWPFCGPQK